MRRLFVSKLSFLCIVGFIIVLVLYHSISLENVLINAASHLNKSFSNSTLMRRSFENTNNEHTKQQIVVSFVVCDQRFDESLNVVKSILLFSKSSVYFVIFADATLQPKFKEKLNKWRIITKNQFDFELQNIQFPKAHEKEWLNLFRKCAAQRLFIPKLIPHKDAMIYVDTDTLFLGPVEELWHFFSKFNSSQISALSLENDNPNISWYPRFAKHPFYGKFGLNSGVMLMNLTRMRDFAWVDYVTPIMLERRLEITWGDQDIINIIFSYKPGAVLVLPCRYNYRSDQCVFGVACAAAARAGVFLLHGSRAAFHNRTRPGTAAFEAIYRAIDEFELGVDLPISVLYKIDKYLNEAPPSTCGTLRESFLKVPTQVLNRTLEVQR